jgi:hypothetical protein
MDVVRGATWKDELIYEDEDGNPIDLTNFEVRMQVRSVPGRYGITTAETLLLDLKSTDPSPSISIFTPPGYAVPCGIQIDIAPSLHTLLNPNTVRRERYWYYILLVDPGSPDYVIPLSAGYVNAYYTGYRA